MLVHQCLSEPGCINWALNCFNARHNPSQETEQRLCDSEPHLRAGVHSADRNSPQIPKLTAEPPRPQSLRREDVLATSDPGLGLLYCNTSKDPSEGGTPNLRLQTLQTLQTL